MLKAKKERTKENRQNVKVEELTSQVHCITLLSGVLRGERYFVKADV